VTDYIGDDNDNTLIGGSGDDLIDGRGGDDRLTGGYGADTMLGGLGRDTFRVFGADMIGDFDTNGDRIDLSYFGVADYASLRPFATQDDQDVVITLGWIRGSAGVVFNTVRLENASIDSLGDADFIFNTSPAARNLTGLVRDDILFGGRGNDTLNGANGNDSVVGGEGKDMLTGGAGDDILIGGAGNDAFIYSARQFGSDTITDFNASGDKIDLSFLHVADFDSLQPFIAQDGPDVVITLGWGGSPEIIRLQNIPIASLDASDFSFLSTQDLVVDGTDSRDVLFGGWGNDMIYGNGGDDALVGGPGKDVLRGGAGADRLIGGAHNDTASYWGAAAAINVNLQSGTGSGGDAQGDTYDGVENVNGGKAGDSLTGDAGSNFLAGYEGNDTLHGGAGTDTLAGGSGADRFVFASIGDSAGDADADVITDFGWMQGDRIDLSLIDADTSTAGNQAFTFIGSGPYTSVAGQLRFSQSEGRTTVEGDVNGDGTSAFHLNLQGVIVLQAADFVL
jgi:Ca2+-binding RTX toxin-like protein